MSVDDTIIDLSSNNHSLYNNGPATIVADQGPYGGAAHWYGTVDSFEVNNFTKLPQFTISFWTAIMDPPQGEEYGSSYGFNWVKAGIVFYNNINHDLTDDDGWGVYVNAPDLGSNQSMRGLISQQTANPAGHEIEILDFDAATSNAWHYITLTYDGTNLVSYVSGQPTNTAQLSLTNSNTTYPTGRLTIGNYGTVPYTGYIGYISEVLILNTALTSNQVNSLYSIQNTSSQLLRDIGIGSLPFSESEVELWTKEFINNGPAITLNGASTITIEQNSSWADPGATAVDALGNSLSVNMVPDYTVGVEVLDTSVLGSETIEYFATDQWGEETTITREITIVTPSTSAYPVITLRGANPLRVPIGSTPRIPGAFAITDIDNGEPNDFADPPTEFVMTESILTGSEIINYNSLGSYTLSYSVTDSAGKSAQTTREIIVEKIKPPLVSSNFTINTYKLADYEMAPSSNKQIPFTAAAKAASNVRKAEKLYAREDKEIREIQAGIKLKDRQPKIYKNMHKLTDVTIDSKHTKVKLQEAFTKKDRKIIYHDIRGGLVYSEVIINQISNKLEELKYLKDTMASRQQIKEQIKSLNIESSIEPQVETIVTNVRNSAP